MRFKCFELYMQVRLSVFCWNQEIPEEKDRKKRSKALVEKENCPWSRPGAARGPCRLTPLWRYWGNRGRCVLQDEVSVSEAYAVRR